MKPPNKKADRSAKAARKTATIDKQPEDCLTDREKQEAESESNLKGEASSILTQTEETRLRELERAVTIGLQRFAEAGLALIEIRDNKLYRATHKTFEAYLKDRWSLSRSHGYQLMDSAEVIKNLSSIADILPSSESVARPLASLEEDEQGAAWNEARELSPTGQPTANDVKQVVDKRKGKKPKADKVLSLGDKQPVKSVQPRGQTRGEFVYMHFEQWVDLMEAKFPQYSNWLNRDSIVQIIADEYPEDREMIE